MKRIIKAMEFGRVDRRIKVLPNALFRIKVAQTENFNPKIEWHCTEKEVVDHVSSLLECIGVNLENDFIVSCKNGHTYKVALILVEVA